MHASKLRDSWNEEYKGMLKCLKIYVWEWKQEKQEVALANLGNARALQNEIV